MPTDSYEQFDLKPVGDVAVVRAVVTEMRHPQSAQEFGSQVRAALQEHGLKNVLIDLRDTRYLGSTAFAMLLNLARNLAAEGGVLKICDLHPDVQVGAKILGLGQAVEIHDDQKSALASFKAQT